MFGRFMDDIKRAIVVILVCGGAVAFFLGLGYLLFLKVFAGCMVWITVLATLLILVAITLIGYAKAGILDQGVVDSAVRLRLQEL